MITVGAMRLPQPEPLDDLEAFLRGLEPDGGYWAAMRRLADHDHSGGLMGPPVAGGGGGTAEVTITGTEGVTVVEGPANVFALGLTASATAGNTLVVNADGLYVPAGAVPPEYVTETEGDLRYLRLATGGTVTGEVALRFGAETTPRLRLQHDGGGITFSNGTASPNAGITIDADGALAFVTDAIRPLSTNVMDVGTSVARWRKVWAQDADFTNAPTVGGSPLLTQATADALFLTPAEGNAAYLPITYTPPATDVAITGTEGVTVVEGPANVFALGLTASPDASNTVEVRANGIYSAAGAIPPEYVTDAELAAALGPYALDTDLANHAAAADPHPAYALDTDLAGYSLTSHNHAALYEPLDSAYTKAESDARYTQGGLTQTTADTRYIQLTGGSVLTGLLGPTTTNTRDLGTTALRWRKLWAVDAEFTNAPTVGGAALLTATTADALFLTPAEGNAAYATPASVTTAVSAHAAAADPHAVYLTQTEGDARYTQGGLTPAAGDARYLQLTGGALSGALSVTNNLSAPGALGLTANAGALSLDATGNIELDPGGNIVYPARDNAVLLGWSGGRWAAVYAVAGAINTSSRKEKDHVGDLDPEAALAAVLRTPARRFRYKGAHRVQSGYYLEEADPLFTIGPDEASATNDAGVLLAAVQALCARLGVTA